MAVENAELPVLHNPAIPEMQRNDAYWVQPVATFVVFVAFIIYATWRTFENDLFDFTQFGCHYLSPFYSPLLPIGWQFFGWHFSPAILILPIPLFFRGTCYYYRKAYYRAFFGDPWACAVREPFARKQYGGERSFPLILQNAHRYAFYLAFIVLVILWWDALLAFDFGGHFGIGVGSLIFLINVVLLSCYTFGCHSWRHLTGGCVNCFSESSTTQTRHGIWQKVSHLNENHALWAWCSLFSVALTDVYVRCICVYQFHDKLIG